MSAPEYRIGTIADFLAVPSDKMDACLLDFATWIAVARKNAEINALMSEALGGEITFSTEYFTWIDDGVEGMSAIDLHEDGGDRMARLDLITTTPKD